MPCLRERIGEWVLSAGVNLSLKNPRGADDPSALSSLSGATANNFLHLTNDRWNKL